MTKQSRFPQQSTAAKWDVGQNVPLPLLASLQLLCDIWGYGVCGEDLFRGQRAKSNIFRAPPTSYPTSPDAPPAFRPPINFHMNAQPSKIQFV
jgi:hypothetical protein